MKEKQAKLPKRFKERWVKALRSGKYKQGVEQLKDGDKYCCLGVAGDLCSVEMEYETVFSQTQFGMKEIEIRNLPKLLRGSTWETEKDFNPTVMKLTEYNDNGKSFKWIASYIERYL